jgi:phosphoenolpyruvate carboxylase
MIDHVKEDYGLPLQIRVIVDDLLENDPDLKPNELLRIINKNRSKYVKIEKELSTQLQNDSNYIPTQRQKKINGAYLFDKKIIPDLSKVTHFFSILINNMY